MHTLVSLCNRHSDRYKEKREIFLLRVNIESAEVHTVPLPHELVMDAWGMTGIAARPGGYVCVLPPAFVLYLSEDLQAQSLHQLTLMRDGHSIVHHGGNCYVASTGNDTIIEFSPDTGESIFWQATDGNADTIHVNSLLWDDAGCWVTAFGPKNGPLWRSAEQGYLLNILTGERLMEGVYHPHSLIKADDTYYLCESSRMRIRSTAGHDVSVPRGYLRGLAIENGWMLAGSTKGRRRSKSASGVIDNSADPGISAGECGISVYRMRGPDVPPEPERFIDLSEYADEIYDIIVVPQT